MKLIRFSTDSGGEPRLGAQLDLPQGCHAVDLQRAYALSAAQQDPFADRIGAVRLPSDMIRFLEGGALSMQAAREAIAHVQAQLDAQGLEELVRNGVLVPQARLRLLAPIERPRKIISCGGNYRLHIEEVHGAGVDLKLPDYPLGFLKMPSAVVGPDEDVLRSRLTEELDYELELGLVVGRRCKDVPASDWRDVIVGITVVNDISMRDIILTEMPSGIPFQGKNLDTACPVGPCIATLDGLGDPQNLDMCLRVNGEIRQQENSSQMLYDIGAIVAYWSRVTLEPGDIITTGTMGGVAGFHKLRPERLLKPGDLIEAEIEHVGVLRNRVVDEIGRSH